MTLLKKTLVLSLLMIVMGTALKGQAALLVLFFGEKVASENFYFSLKAGINYSMITGYDEGDNRTGLNFGLINNIKLNDKLYLTPEFLALSPRGVRHAQVLTTGNPDLDSLLTGPISTDRRLSYIDVPVLLKYKISKRWSISAGPQISYLSAAQDIYQSEPVKNAVLKTEIDIKGKIRSWDLAGVINVTFMVSEAIAGKGMNLYLRYSHGFLDLSPDDSQKKYYNSTLQFGASFPFIEKQE